MVGALPLSWAVGRRQRRQPHYVCFLLRLGVGPLRAAIRSNGPTAVALVGYGSIWCGYPLQRSYCRRTRRLVRWCGYSPQRSYCRHS